MFFKKAAQAFPSGAEALPGRTERMAVPEAPLRQWASAGPAVSRGARDGDCSRWGGFWGAERKFLQLKGVYSDRPSGYMRGALRRIRPYREVCTGMTGHTGSRPRRLRSEK